MRKPNLFVQALMMSMGLLFVPASPISAKTQMLQQNTVTASGTVVDAKGEPVIGATIL